MPVTVPIRDLKDTSKITQTVREADGPVIVTKNGYSEMVIVTPEEYDELERARTMQQIYHAIGEAEARMNRGEGIDGEELMAKLREKYGLSD